VRSAVDCFDAARAHQEFREMCNGLLKPLARKDGVLYVNAMIDVEQINRFDFGSSPRADKNAIICIITIGLRGSDITNAIDRSCAGDVRRFYDSLLRNPGNTPTLSELLVH